MNSCTILSADQDIGLTYDRLQGWSGKFRRLACKHLLGAVSEDPLVRAAGRILGANNEVEQGDDELEASDGSVRFVRCRGGSLGAANARLDPPVGSRATRFR
jgi:hypothetical protein